MSGHSSSIGMSTRWVTVGEAQAASAHQPQPAIGSDHIPGLIEKRVPSELFEDRCSISRSNEHNTSLGELAAARGLVRRVPAIVAGAGVRAAAKDVEGVKGAERACNVGTTMAQAPKWGGRLVLAPLGFVGGGALGVVKGVVDVLRAFWDQPYSIYISFFMIFVPAVYDGATGGAKAGWQCLWNRREAIATLKESFVWIDWSDD